MSDFEWVQLGKIAAITMGQSPDSETYTDDDRYIPFLQGCGDFTGSYPETGVFCTSPGKVAKEGSLLVSVRAPVGTTNVADKDYCIGRGLAAVKSNIVSALYLREAFTVSASFLHRRAQGSTFDAICAKDLSEMKIPMPKNRRVGEKVTDIIQCLNSELDATQALIDKYTAIKQGMMADLFSRGIDPETKTLRPTFEEAPELYYKTPLGMLPKGWKVIELENLLDEVTSPMRSGPFGSALLKEELVSEGIPLLGIDNIFVERFKASYKRFVTERKFRELSRYAVRERDVVITIMGTVGRSCVIPESIGLALSSKHLWTMTFDKEQILPELVCWQLNHSPWAESWFRRESQGGVMDAIQSQTLKKLKLVVPSPVEQNAIYERYENLNNHIEVNQTSLDKLKLQKTGLMQDLLTGKVPVPA
ncbi:restriction endonuclease subunit S [Photobacterium damselae]|uniref:Type I restriction-modification system specificity subunit S n=2 Tax=Photobacterium damselae TaxID=38293 RepID=D0YZS3_PHODD|nr:restriction endonuclease subunit S [Photobacterium damselae]EEZ41754.1 type I restriction-modification system specificity subunit S [Photobacterium damselae subsp. damselae CIP 102761]PSW85306.1 restriction endonuclease subunit S [Photobacterium damselae]SPY27384.1 EcoKI restriction-modification system protein HsdS [Photobacterium damselae]